MKIIFDSQEGELCGTKSCYEEFEEDNIDEGEYAITKLRSLEDLWWLDECPYNVESL